MHATMSEEEVARIRASRETEIKAMREAAGIAEEVASRDARTQFVLSENGVYLRCAVCRNRIEEGKEYRDFRCTVGCRVYLHAGPCSKSLIVPETGGKLTWSLGMRCLTDLAQPGSCIGTGIFGRLAGGGAKYTFFEAKMKEHTIKPSTSIAVPAAPTAVSVSTSLMTNLNRKARRMQLHQTYKAPEHPGARTPAVSNLPPEQFLVRDDPVKTIHPRNAKSEKVEKQASRSTREKAKEKNKKTALPVNFTFKDAKTDASREKSPLRSSDADTSSESLIGSYEMASSSFIADVAPPGSMAARLASQIVPSRDAFPPLLTN